MTDAQQALAQVREAMAAGPTPGEWVCYDDSSDGKTNRIEIVAIGKTVARIYRSVPEQDLPNARLIAACSPANMTAILAHVEAQAAEIERLTAERDELRRQLAEAEMDAERYRWLRNEANTARKCDPMVCIYPLDEQDLIDGDRLDIAIDAAMGLTRPAEES